MGSINYGTQVRSIGFFDPANSGVVNKRNVGVQPVGIYSGGYLTPVTTTTASMSPLVCIIGDGTYQLRVETTVAVDGTYLNSFTPTNKYVVLRWLHTETDPTNEYMDVLVQTAAQIQTNDIIVGVGTFTGADLTGFTYADTTYPRTEANVHWLLGKIEAEETPTMYLRVRGFNANYGSANLKVYNSRCADASSFPIPTAVSNPRVDVIYLDTDGIVKRFAGRENSDPTLRLPALGYQNKIALAEVTVGVGVSTITQSNIKDVRPFTTGSTTTVNGSQLANLSGITAGAGVIPAANLPTGPWLTIPTLAGNALKYLRVNAAATAIEFVPPTYS